MEFLANEEDTVIVGQDLVRLELGSAPQGEEKEKDASEPKDSASSGKATLSDPELMKKGEPKAKDESSPAPPPPPQEKKPESKEAPPPKQSESKTDTKSSSATPALGNREERRV